MTVNMHLFHGNKIVQMKKYVFKGFQALLLEFKYFQIYDFATFKDFKHLYEPCK